jgi:hypothetical protein
MVVWNVQRWSDEVMFARKSEVFGQASVMSDDPVQNFDQLRGRWRFAISERLCKCPQIPRAVLCQSITVRLGTFKFCAGWVPKVLNGYAQNAFFFFILERCHKDFDKFLIHIVQVTGDGTRV